jgi:hypothetical protein
MVDIQVHPELRNRIGIIALPFALLSLTVFPVQADSQDQLLHRNGPSSFAEAAPFQSL